MRGLKSILPLLVLLIFAACGTGGKLGRLAGQQTRASLTLPAEKQVEFHELKDDYRPADTLTVVDINGHQSLIMNAVREESTGEMVAHDVIQAAVVTARFRNVPERHGKIELEYQICVPEDMIDRNWQLRFSPRMVVMGDTVSLDEVYLTGTEFRRVQNRGYERYGKYVSSIVTDTSVFVAKSQLERFVERNIASGNKSEFGVTERDAIDHYTYWYLVSRNGRKEANRDKMFRRFVKTPYATGVRIDTVAASFQGGFVYDYRQTISARPNLRKVEILLSGSIYESDKLVYSMPESDPLTFYISSISSFASDCERYLSKTVYRRMEANTACFIDFRQGKSVIEDTLSNNSVEIGRIKENLKSLMVNEEFDIDSIVVTASGSPEGSYSYNSKLSMLRSRSASEYFAKYMDNMTDSLSRASGSIYNLDDSYDLHKSLAAGEIKFVSRMEPENWAMLDAIVRNDIVLDDGEKEEYFAHSGVSDPDAREKAMQKDSRYKYYREVLYPRVRTVKFDFYLHRKGMVEESVQTTEIDTLYMAGVQAIKDRNYEKAVTLLRPYGDFNTAVAFCAMDYNASALAILEELEKTAEVNYLLAIIYSRQGKDRQAVECYLNSCALNSSFVHRGNLDPEISALINNYNLHKNN